MKNEWVDATQKPELGRLVLIKIHTDIEKKNKYKKSSNFLKKEELTEDMEQIVPGSWTIPEWAGVKLNNGNPVWCLPIALNPEFQTVIAWKYENM